MNKHAAMTMTKARTALILDAPFYGQLALRLNMVENNGIKTMAVNGKTIFYNADFVEKLQPELVKSAIGHEVLHCVFGHIGRLDGRDQRKWNRAGDYVINHVLKESNFQIGDNWLYNPQYANMSADEIYKLLDDSQDDKDDPFDEVIPGGQDGSGEGVDANAEALDWRIATIAAANKAKEFGKLPGSLERFVEQFVKPKANWRDLLRNFITEITKNDYAWSRPNRRFLAQGIYLPGLFSESMGEIAVAIDTSGSIDQKTLNKFGSEISAIVDSVRPNRIHVIYCDSHVNHVDTFEQNDELKFKLHGGGGTDFRPPFEYLKENNITPACFIYLTDLYGPIGDAPHYPVLWACINSNQAPWGTTICIED